MYASQVILPKENPAGLELFQGTKGNVFRDGVRQLCEDRLKEFVF